METKQALETKAEMTPETYRYFISGLRIAINAAGYQENDFAEGICHPVTLSNNLTGKRTMVKANIDKCAQKLNKEVSDIVLIGKKETNKQYDYTPAHLQQPSPGKQQYMSPTQMLSVFSLFIGQCQDLEKDMLFWKTVFDVLPTPALIVENRVVIHQNVKSSAWGSIVGTSLCESCACPDNCKQNNDCPTHQAIETRNPTIGHQHIGAGFYRVEVIPMRLHDREYFVIFATEADLPDSAERRRNGGDRRAGE